MDIGSAFTFAFDDEDWIKKLAIGGAIYFGAALLSPILVGLALFLPLMGYMFETLKSVRDGQPTPLPEWGDFGGLFSKGGMVVVIAIVYYIPAILLYCASFAMQLGAAQLDSDVAQMAGIALICVSCLQILAALAGGFLFPAALIRYAQYETLGAAFQFGEIFSFIRDNIGDYIIVFLLAWVAGLIAGFGIILCFIGVFFTSFWSMLVSANLYGQLARKAGGMSASF